MNNSGVYLEARTISGPFSWSCLSVGLLFTYAQTKQVSGEQMLIAFGTIVQSTNRFKDFIFFAISAQCFLASMFHVPVKRDVPENRVHTLRRTCRVSFKGFVLALAEAEEMK